jgi:uncharacterized membrane protein YqgA involved in biofilm formation
MGTLINAAGIIIASIIGVMLKSKVSKNFIKSMKDIMGLTLLFLSIGWFIRDFIVVDNHFISTRFDLEILVILILGTVIGSLLSIDERFNQLIKRIETKHQLPPLAEGFITASLIFCVGAMAIIGVFQDVIQGNITILVMKTIFDMITALILASTLGIGVMFSSISVLLYQGLWMVFAFIFKTQFSESMLLLISLMGNILIAGLAFNFLEIKQFKVLNMLPAIIIVIIYGLFI